MSIFIFSGDNPIRQSFHTGKKFYSGGLRGPAVHGGFACGMAGPMSGLLSPQAPKSHEGEEETQTLFIWLPGKVEDSWPIFSFQLGNSLQKQN